jgi:hypothetical protein
MGNIKIHNEHPSLIIENIDIQSEWFFLSSFQTYQEDKEVKHVQDETV